MSTQKRKRAEQDDDGPLTNKIIDNIQPNKASKKTPESQLCRRKKKNFIILDLILNFKAISAEAQESLPADLALLSVRPDLERSGSHYLNKPLRVFEPSIN
ncbi:hypothetical protein K439DRAFT_1615720 [Ramaria rubella]|nr:hypothetical protein K439DRAFT_1615720 [Ramaria rubella]